jgi:hypothetical protein
MRHRHLRSPVLLGVLMLAGVLLLPAPLQAQTATGAIGGTITDGTAPVPGVTVTATNVDTGFSRTVTTTENGSFRFPSVPAGVYTVKAELSGFATVTVERVEVRIATTRTLEVTMKPSKVAESLTVTAEAPLVETTPSIGTVVSQEELQSLPLNGRQFANLAVLAPGTLLSYNSDPTKPGQLVVQLNGGGGRNVNYMIDGGDNTDDTIGGALQNFSLESVQEFKIQTMQYKAEYGRSSGGVLTVVTKTGTNDFHGSAFGFFRKDSWNSKTETEKQAGIPKQAYDRKQYGVSIGGPIVKDKVHFFATYEKTKRDTNYTVNTDGLFPTFDGTVVPTPFEDQLAAAKATYDISAKQYLQVRYGYQKNADKYGASPLAAPDGMGTVTNKYSSILAGWTAQISAEMLNEFVFQYTKFDNAITADSQAPLIYYPSGFHTGQNLNTPQTTHQVKYQYKDDFSFSKTIAGRRHDFKAGVAFINEPTLGGDFSTGLAGQYTALEDRIGSPIALIQQYGGFFGDKTPTKQYSAYFQDDWYFSNHLTFNIGLRYDYYDALTLDQSTNAIWQVLSTQTTYNESYLRDFQGGGGRVLKNEKTDFSPRLGFSWDVKGDARHVVRGGVGRFYDFPYTNATILFPAAALGDYGVYYQYEDANGIRNADGSYWQPGQPFPTNQLPPPYANVADEVASPTLKPPYSDQISLGYSWQAADWLGFNFEAVSTRYHHIPFRFRPNIIDSTTGQRRWPQFGTFRIWYGKGSASYDGLNVGVRIRKEKFELQGFYTLSRSEGNVLGGADDFRLTPGEGQSDIGGVRNRRDQSINPLDPLCDACYGPLYTDARHRVSFGGTYLAPWGISLSGMLRYRSPLPYLEHTNADTYGTGNWLNLRPGVSHVNTGRGASFTQFDLRVSKDFTFGGDLGVEVLAEVFNVFNSKNPVRPNRFGVPSQYAGDPLQGEQRLAQFGLRVHF